MSFWNLYARVYDTLSNLVPYQDMLERIIELAGPLPGKKVLNVGCGTGNLEHKILLAHPDVDILGVDSSAAMLSRAHKKCGKHHFRQADLNKPLKQQGFGNGFDILIGVNVLYAVTDPVETLKELRSVARPNARIIQTSPRAGAGILPILWEHRREAGNRNLRHHPIKLYSALLIVGIFNVIILLWQKGGKYHFPDEKQLRSWFEHSGWKVKTIENSYANQNWLLVAEADPKFDA